MSGRRNEYTGNLAHPTGKAVGALRPLIEAFASAGAMVLDPFAGSGGTRLRDMYADPNMLMPDSNAAVIAP